MLEFGLLACLSSDCGLFGGCRFLFPGCGKCLCFSFFLLVVSLVFVWPVPGMWAVVSSL